MSRKIALMGLMALVILAVLSSQAYAWTGLSCPWYNRYFYTTVWQNEQGQPVSQVRAQVYECLDPSCQTLGRKVGDTYVRSNRITVQYCSGSWAPKYGYATYWYSPGYIRQEMWFKPSWPGRFTDYTTFTKYPYCRARVSELQVPVNLTQGQSVQITVRVKSPISDAPPSSTTPRANPIDPEIVDRYLSAKVKVDLNVYDQNGILVWQDNQTALIREDTERDYVFTWTPALGGEYRIEAVTDSVDSKCAYSIQDTLIQPNISVHSVNQPPVLSLPQNITFEEDNWTVLNLDDYVQDEDPDSSLVWSVTGTNFTIVAIDPLTHQANFSAQPDWNGQEVVTFTVRDTQGLSASQNVTVIVLPVNDRPVAQDINLTTQEDTAVNVSLICTDVDGDNLTYSVSQPANGQVTGSGSLWTYQPNQDFNGQDSFTYSCSDGILTSNNATVIIQVLPVNDQPVALDDYYQTLEDVQLNVSSPGVLQNDTDVDGDNLTAILVTQAGNGTVQLNANGSFTYQPNPDWYGNDSFTYLVTDGELNSSPATVWIEVLPVNDQPIAVIDSPANGSSWIEGQAVSFNGSSSWDIDGHIVNYTWDFGDGNISSTSSPVIQHVYQQNGTYQVTLTVTDDQGATGAASITILVNDTQPQVNFSWVPASPVEGEQVNFTDLSSAYDGISGWEWDFDSDGLIDSVEQNPVWTFSQNGIYQVTLTVTDGDGSRASITQNVTVGDTQPQVNFTWTPANPVEGQQVDFIDLSSAYDGVVAWFWDFGDGSNSTQQNASHIYQQNGTYQVTLTVTDGDGSQVSFSQNIAVADTQPIANFSWTPIQPMEGEQVNFTDGFATHDSIVAWFWDFGDGTNSTEENPVHVYQQNGTYTVTLTVWDADGSQVSSSQNLTVLDSSPTADAGQDVTAYEGDVVTFNASNSTGWDQPLAYYWDFGDGTNSTGQVVQHVYADNGTYQVTLTVVDADGSQDTAVITATILDVDPIAAFSFSQPLYEGQAISFNASASQPGASTDPISSYLWDFGDGNTSSTSSPVIQHVYADNGNYTVILTVLDEDSQNQSQQEVTVLNVPPVLQPVGDQQVSENQTLTIQLNATDVPADSLIYGIDASLPSAYSFDPVTGLFTWTPTFDDAGNYTVNFTVQDDDGGIDWEVIQIEVINVNRPPQIAIPDQTLAEDTQLQLNLSNYSHDPDGDNLTYSVVAENASEVDCQVSGDILTLIPAENWNGLASCTIQTSDGLASANSTFQINVTPMNDQPNITNPVSFISLQVGETWTYDFDAEDVDGDSLTWSDNTSLFDIDPVTGQVSFTAQESQAGNYTIAVRVSDGMNQSENVFTLEIIDNVSPRISLILPENRTYSTGQLELNFTVEDANLDSCWYVLDGSRTDLLNCQNTSISVSDGQHHLTVYANDTYGNLGQDVVWFTVDTSLPLVSFVQPTPADNSYLNQTQVVINITASHSSFNIDSCQLEWNGVNYTMNMVGSGKQVTCYYQLSGLTDGQYSYMAYANASGRIGSTGSRTLTIDTVAPIISISSPANQTYSNQTVWLNVTADEPASWSYSLNSGSEVAFNPNLTIDAVEGQNHLVVYARDQAGNRGSAEVWFTVDTTPPTISNVKDYPGTTSALITWDTDEPADSRVEYGTSQSLGLIVSNSTMVTAHQINLTGLQANTTYYYNVTSCDQVGNCRTEGPFNFTTQEEPDVQPPIVILESPVDGQVITSSQATVSFRAEDDRASVLTCWVYSNTSGTWTADTSLSVLNSSTQSHTYNGLPDGVYEWNVECTDGSNSTWAPSNWTFTISTAVPPAYGVDVWTVPTGQSVDLLNRPAVYQVKVNNTGDVSNTFTITVDGDGAETSLNQTSITLNPGEIGTVELRVNSNNPGTFNINVSVTGTDAFDWVIAQTNFTTADTGWIYNSWIDGVYYDNQSTGIFVNINDSIIRDSEIQNVTITDSSLNNCNISGGIGGIVMENVSYTNMIIYNSGTTQKMLANETLNCPQYGWCTFDPEISGNVYNNVTSPVKLNFTLGSTGYVTNNYFEIGAVEIKGDSHVNNSIIISTDPTNPVIIEDSDVFDSVIRNSDIQNSTINSSEIANSTITDSEIVESNIEESTIRDSTLTQVNATNSTIINSSLSGVTLTDAWVENGELINGTMCGDGWSVIDPDQPVSPADIPTLNFKAEPSSGKEPLKVNFIVEINDPAGLFNSSNATYRWIFGDGAEIETKEPNINHTYSHGTFIVNVTAKSDSITLWNNIEIKVSTKEVPTGTTTISWYNIVSIGPRNATNETNETEQPAPQPTPQPAPQPSRPSQPSVSVGPVCGDGVCEAGEDCPQDCQQPPAGPGLIGLIIGSPAGLAGIGGFLVGLFAVFGGAKLRRKLKERKAVKAFQARESQRLREARAVKRKARR